MNSMWYEGLAVYEGGRNCLMLLKIMLSEFNRKRKLIGAITVLDNVKLYDDYGNFIYRVFLN